MNGQITIGKLAENAGVNRQTIFYYERRGLLSPTRRTDAGYRLYEPEAVRVIRFVKNAQELGFSLDEIARLLKLRVGRRTQCGTVRKQAVARLKIVKEKITTLRSMERVLNRLVKTCARSGTTNSCPILESLKDGGKKT